MKVSYKGKVTAVEVAPTATLQEVRKAVGAAIKKSWTRVELRDTDPNDTVKPKEQVKKFSGETKTAKDLGLLDVPLVYVKDIGPQFSYRGVFAIEYAGPIAIVALFALRPAFLFGSEGGLLRFWESLTLDNAAAPGDSKAWSRFVQALAIAMWLAHFLKREFETFFVHKFSRPTMPLFQLFKNSAYYWGFATFVGFPLVNAAYTAPADKSQVAVGAALWLVSQAVNFSVHWQLSRMRPGGDGSNDRKPPMGPLFALVSCPNYTAEVLGWVAWSLMTQIGMAYAFTLVGLGQMSIWALDKHRGYFKTDKGYAKLGRKAIIPFVL